MYFPELSRLREDNPDLAEAIDRLDQYLAGLKDENRFHVTASSVANAIRISQNSAIGLLMAAAKLGILRLKFRVSCPEVGAGIRDFSELSEIPRELKCDLCGENHTVTPDDIEYFFEVKDKALGARR
jgi:hypothetical protein